VCVLMVLGMLTAGAPAGEAAPKAARPQEKDAGPKQSEKTDEKAEQAVSAVDAKAIAAARGRGLAWLGKHQAKDGSWGKTYTVAVTSFACLSYLSASDEPFAGDDGKVLTAGLEYLMKAHTDGQFPSQGHSWIHGQGFAALALAEAYGRTLFCKTQPDLDRKKLKATVAAAVKVIAVNQSTSGGWWYTPGSRNQHEGSTTVCAVQAMVAAQNFGIEIDEDVLDKGFAYLKKCQNNDGGFDYMLNESKTNTSMKEGTAGDVATLALMKKFDFEVMIDAYEFLVKLTPQAITKERFPYYGHFYGCMGMKLLGQEMKSYRQKTDAYIAGAHKDILSWQTKDGSWPVTGWVKANNQEGEDYATAFATLLLSVPDGRLSIFHRTPPKLPKA